MPSCEFPDSILDSAKSNHYSSKDEERMSKVDGYLKDARNKADEADKQYDEISKKLQFTEGELEKAEERGENGEMKIMELEEELKVVASNLKSLEVSEEKANKREIANKEQVKTLTAKLKQAVARADFAERSVLKLNMEVGFAKHFPTCDNHANIFETRSLGALWAPTSSLRPFGPPLLCSARPLGAQAM